jgi:enoyl-CoA hydratase/carnithine racemase
LDRDNFMSAEDALKYGLIDEIVQPNDEKLRSLSMPPPTRAPQLAETSVDDIEYEFGKLV